MRVMSVLLGLIAMALAALIGVGAWVFVQQIFILATFSSVTVMLGLLAVFFGLVSLLFLTFGLTNLFS